MNKQAVLSFHGYYIKYSQIYRNLKGIQKDKKYIWKQK